MHIEQPISYKTSEKRRTKPQILTSEHTVYKIQSYHIVGLGLRFLLRLEVLHLGILSSLEPKDGHLGAGTKVLSFSRGRSYTAKLHTIPVMCANIVAPERVQKKSPKLTK